MQKYRNKKVIHNGLKFDSQAEFRYFLYYKSKEDNGEIGNLRLQVPFEIVINGKKICKYIADFTYTDKDGFHVVDIKSPITEKDKVFRLKKKLVEAVHNVKIEIVK